MLFIAIKVYFMLSIFLTIFDNPAHILLFRYDSTFLMDLQSTGRTSFALANSLVIVAKHSNGKGVKIASDSFSSSYMIENRNARKIFPLIMQSKRIRNIGDANNVYLCCIAGEADFHRLLEAINLDARYRNLQIGDCDDESSLDVQSIAHLARKLITVKYRKVIQS
jgi:hypothetical protein